MKRGNCYVTSEALYHLLGGRAAGDLCGYCLTPLRQLAHGAQAQCCSGNMYWSPTPPLARDERFSWHRPVLT